MLKSVKKMDHITILLLVCYIASACMIYHSWRNACAALGGGLIAAPFICIALYTIINTGYVLGVAFYIPEHNVGLCICWLAILCIRYFIRVHKVLPDVGELIGGARVTLYYYCIYRFVMLFKPPTA